MSEKNKSASSTVSSKSDVITIDFVPFLSPIARVISSLVLGVCIIIASNNLSGKVGVGSGTATGTTPTPTAAAGTGEEFPAVSTKIDDTDPVLGDKSKVKVAIVEYGDFECPYCKRHAQQVYPTIIQEYIDSGKAIYVYKDFPLSFHEPGATDEAGASQCVYNIGGNAKFYDYKKLIYDNTNSNGNGLAKSKLYDFAGQVGVDGNQFKDCFDNGKYKDEVTTDTSEGTAAGITGTPGFVIGVLGSDGTVDGKRIDGAYPIEDFRKIIDEMLAK